MPPLLLYSRACRCDKTAPTLDAWVTSELDECHRQFADRKAQARPPAAMVLGVASGGGAAADSALLMGSVHRPSARAGVSQVRLCAKGFLSYLAFMRQVGDTGACVFTNPFTTEPQSPRFVLLFHWVLGAVATVTGHSNAVLELSRLPLIFLFFWVLWRFLLPVLPDHRERLCACVLVAFSGGLESYLGPLLSHFHQSFRSRSGKTRGNCTGWNTFASCFNPLWVAALIAVLVTIAPILRPSGLTSARDWFQVSAGFLGTYLIHPYPAIFVLTLALTVPVTEWMLRPPIRIQKHVSVLAALTIPGLLLLLLSSWQAQDQVYRQSASGIFGPQAVSIFWYPLTLGLLLLGAIRGGRIWAAELRPYFPALLAWIGAVVLLHTSPLLNGYKFVFLLHLPVCILATPAVVQLAVVLWRGRNGRGAWPFSRRWRCSVRC